MDINRLTHMKIGILTEANDAGIPDPEKLVNGFVKEQVEAGNMVEEDTQNNNPQPNQQPQQEPPVQDQQQDSNQNQDVSQDRPDDNPYALDSQDSNAADAQMDQGDDTDMPDVPDDYNAEDESPKLKILQSLTDKEYKLNNIHCHEQFKELYNNVENSINNYIMNIVTKNVKQRQIVTHIHNNLSRMLDDLNTYIVYKFSDIYEDNILAYTTFLKRYQIAMKIIKLISEENQKVEK